MLLSTIALAGLLGLSGAHEPDACRTKSVSAQPGRLFYRDCGNRAFRPIIVVPGGPGLDASYIRPLADMIMRLQYRVILLEPRGTGLSRAALGDGTQLTVEGSIADIDIVRRAAGVNKAVILGHSFGGEVAQAYAAAFPNRVQALVLMDSAGPGGPAPTPLDGWRKRATDAELTRYDTLRAGGDRVGAMRIKFKWSFYDPDAADHFLKAMPDTAVHLDVMPLSANYDRSFHVPPVAHVPFTVTLVAGQIDWIRGYEPAFQTVYPDLQLFVVPKAGHFPWADAPDETRRILGQVLNKRASTP